MRESSRSPSILRRFALNVLWVFLLLAPACAAAPKRVVILVDGQRLVAETQAVTVQDLLTEKNITLGDNDRVDPPLYAEVGRSATITVTRVQVKTETVNQPIPFTRQLVQDESFPENQVRVLQLGANGTTQITYAITIQDGKEAERHETTRKIITQPKDEILAVGTQGSLPSVPITGTIVYLANGNAWLMRHSSGEKRPLTSTTDLDGRVFSLSPDGRYLLFSRLADPASNSLNTLWIIDTLVLGETPRALPLKDILYAQLSPDAKSVAYSTGEKTAGAPGWKAHNDLWIASSGISGTASAGQNPRLTWKANMPAAYGWWGTNFAWSPDGRTIAYAFSNEVGFINVAAPVTATDDNRTPRRPLKTFAPFRARADWVWIPHVGWSPDSRFIIGIVHAPLGNPSVASDDPIFEVWALGRDNPVNVPLATQTGMWSDPVWSPPDAKGESRIAYGIALTPSDSERSRYALDVMDRDGGNKVQIFPQKNESGLTVLQMAWSQDARQLVAVRDDDLWLYDFGAARWSQLTANAASALPQWGK